MDKLTNRPVTNTAPTAKIQPADEAIAALEEAAKVLAAEAGFHGQPGSQVYDNLAKLAERCTKAAAALKSAG